MDTCLRYDSHFAIFDSWTHLERNGDYLVAKLVRLPAFVLSEDSVASTFDD